jgi:tetratricopeptide (TPR) repeat protein
MLAEGDAQSALEVYEQLDVGSRHLAGIAIAQHALGNAEASDAALQALLEWDGAQAWAYRVAQVYAYRGEIDRAFEELDRAFDNRENYLAGDLFDPRFDNLRDDPRWPAFLDKMGYPQ